VNTINTVRTVERTGEIDDYYRRYVAIAQDYDVGFIFESTTWRASADWGRKLGYSQEALAEMNRQSIW
jgi:hypothetical protein